MATISGTNQSDVLNAADGVTPFDDWVYGRQGKDEIYGLGGDDHLFGNQGKDHLFGGDGDDFLTGGPGKDKLTGGDGEDTFVFNKGSGKDVVVDFDLDQDILQIMATNKIKEPEDVLKQAKQLNNGDVQINLGKGGKIILKNTDLNELKKNPGDHFDIV
jgi:Ca2+-binding RTX toxin-like protein